jgi:hypothetical protein
MYQHHVRGHDDLNIYEWAQGILAIIEYEENITMRYMLSQYRVVIRDTQSHGFNAAKWSSSVVLSLLEKCKVTWDQTYKMAEECISTLVAISSPQKEHFVSPQPRDTSPSCQAQYGGNSGGNNNGNGRFGNRKLTKLCVFYNNGSCLNAGHHKNGTTRLRDMCVGSVGTPLVERECSAN